MTDSIRSVDRTLDLLTVVCAHSEEAAGYSLVDCAKATDLPPSTALRFLRSLAQRGFVTRDEDGMFHPGVELLRLGASALSHDSLTRIARPAMRRLATDVNESVYLVVRGTDNDCLYLAIEECAQPIRHVSWVGKTFAAKGSAADQVLSGKVPLGESAYEEGTIERDVTAICSPIIAANQVIAAMSVLAPSYRMDDDNRTQTAQLLCAACRTVSQQLGT